MRAGKSRLYAIAFAVLMSAGYAALPAEKLPEELSNCVYAATLLSAPTGLSVSSASGKMNIKWESVRGADAYRVYIYDNAQKKWKKYKTVTGTVCSLTGLTQGKTYYFVVSALDKNGKNYTEGMRTSKFKVTYSPKSAANTNKKRPALPSVTDYGFDDRTSKYDGKYTAVGRDAYEADYEDVQQVKNWENERNREFKAYLDKMIKDGFELKKIDEDITEGDMTTKTNIDLKIYFNGKQVGTLRRSYILKAEKGAKYKGGMRISGTDEIYVIMK